MIAKIYNGNRAIEFEVPDSKLVKKQEKTVVAPYESGVFPRVIHKLRLSYDDSCGNLHNTFAITIDTTTRRTISSKLEYSGGSDWEAIKEHFPDYAHLTPFHGCSSHGPMHYLGNSIYLAGIKDHNGLLKGEVRFWDAEIQFIGFPIRQPTNTHLLKFLEDHTTMDDFKYVDVVEVQRKVRQEDEGYVYSNNFVFSGMEEDWYKSVASNKMTADRLLQAFKETPYVIINTPTTFSEGKDPDLEGARGCAIWVEAELEDFTEEKLMARLPGLMTEFKGRMEDIGFEY